MRAFNLSVISCRNTLCNNYHKNFPIARPSALVIFLERSGPKANRHFFFPDVKKRRLFEDKPARSSCALIREGKMTADALVEKRIQGHWTGTDYENLSGNCYKYFRGSRAKSTYFHRSSSRYWPCRETGCRSHNRRTGCSKNG